MKHGIRSLKKGGNMPKIYLLNYLVAQNILYIYISRLCKYYIVIHTGNNYHYSTIYVRQTCTLMNLK